MEFTEKVKTSVANLRKLDKEHTAMGMEIMKASNGALFPLDLFAIPVLNRSEALLSGFCDLIEKKNFISAAPLLRLQLDNLLRFQAAWLVDKPHDFALEVFGGKHIKDMKDRNGNKMTDRYLVDQISLTHPILKSVYEHTSGYIHLSEKHIFNSLGQVSEGRKFTMKVGSTDSFIREVTYLEAIRAFFEITGILFSYLKGWAITKDKGTPPAKYNH